MASSIGRGFGLCGSIEEVAHMVKKEELIIVKRLKTALAEVNKL